MQSRDGRLRRHGGGAGDPVEYHERQPGQASAAAEAAGQAGFDDPWYDALASGWGELDGTGAPAFVAPATGRDDGDRSGSGSAVDIYLEVQRSAAFQEVRSRYRRFVVPGVAVFFTWYVSYVVTATAAPELMARPVTGAVNVAMLAGLGQFLSTFLFTWAYMRHARLRRDRAALDLRWDTQELARGVRGSER